MELNFKKGLIPAIIQDYKNNEILMLGYINKKALEKTLQTGWVYFWSRSRRKLWMKGETSGNKLKVKKILKDCDEDTILIRVKLIGTSACHTGNKQSLRAKARKTCFYQEVK